MLLRWCVDGHVCEMPLARPTSVPHKLTLATARDKYFHVLCRVGERLHVLHLASTLSVVLQHQHESKRDETLLKQKPLHPECKAQHAHARSLQCVVFVK